MLVVNREKGTEKNMITMNDKEINSQSRTLALRSSLSSGFGRASAYRLMVFYNHSSGRRRSSRSASVPLSACRTDLFFGITILSLSIKKVLTYLCVWFKIDNCVGTPSGSSKPP